MSRRMSNSDLLAENVRLRQAVFEVIHDLPEDDGDYYEGHFYHHRQALEAAIKGLPPEDSRPLKILARTIIQIAEFRARERHGPSGAAYDALCARAKALNDRKKRRIADEEAKRDAEEWKNRFNNRQMLPREQKGLIIEAVKESLSPAITCKLCGQRTSYLDCEHCGYDNLRATADD